MIPRIFSIAVVLVSLQLFSAAPMYAAQPPFEAKTIRIVVGFPQEAVSMPIPAPSRGTWENTFRGILQSLSKI
jgi:hypothetical protein